MKSYIVALISIFSVLLSVGTYIYAAEESSTTGSVEATSSTTKDASSGTLMQEEDESLLLVKDIITVDDKHIIVAFNQDIIQESVRVRISEQGDESNILIDSFTGAENNYSIQVILKDSLSPDTAYKMTIISAISEEGIIIKDGADGIKEFDTPEDLKIYEPVTLNAPANPNAVMVAASSTGSTTGSTMLPASTSTGEVTPSETAGELPLTGMNPALFLLIAAILAFILVVRRRHA